MINRSTYEEPAEAKLRRLVAVVMDSNDAITVQDFEGNIIEWNKGAERMFGYSEAEALAMNIRDIVPKDKSEEERAFARKLQEREEVDSFETQRLTKDGKRLDVWLTVTRLVDSEGKPVGIATTERDITERKRVEEELRRTNEELKSFVDVVSHDLKNPIFGIQGFSALLLKKYQEKLDDKGREYLENIRTDARRIESLVSDLLALAQAGQVVSTLGDVALSAIVKNVTLNLKDRIEEKGIKLIVADNLPEIYCDEDRIHQVFENLLVNAIKFLGNNQPHKVEVGYKDMGAYCQFHVKDNGIGIDPKYHQKIFEKFKRLEEIEDDEGTGLGLAIVKKIVNGHGGRVWVESEKGKGATFYFTLPK
jgi:PAS domain S-box-containing protein